MGGPTKTALQFEITEGEGVCVVYGVSVGWRQ